MSVEIDQIYQDGRHYDQLFGSSGSLPAFWFEAADAYGSPLLELGCGTGRIAIPLAGRGHAVTGIDRSESMLAEARRKGAAAGVAIDWQYADMPSFALGRQFKLAIIANNALCHLLTLADFEQSMAAIRSHLVEDGRLIIDVFVPNLALLLRTEDQLEPFSEYEAPDGSGRVIVTSRSRYDPAAQTRYNTTYYRYPNRADEVAGSLTMRMYFPQELDALFKCNGFRIEYKYGGFDRRPFDALSTMQLLILTKT
jgi:SAM-dependent methyltransferase